MISQRDEETVLRFLPYYIVIALALDKSEIAEILKTAMTDKLGVSVEDLKKYIKRLLADKERAAELRELTTKFN